MEKSHKRYKHWSPSLLMPTVSPATAMATPHNSHSLGTSRANDGSGASPAAIPGRGDGFSSLAVSVAAAAWQPRAANALSSARSRVVCMCL